MEHDSSDAPFREAGAPFPRPRINSSKDMLEYLRGIVRTGLRESLYAVNLSGRQEVLSWSELWWGAGVVPRPGVRSVYAGALSVDARFLIVAHYLPEDDPMPSLEDYARTRRLVRVGELLDIDVLDSMVMGKRGYRSMLGYEPRGSG